ncbi:hypothetical protein N7474_006702 [Penicillium riverlandense]|uniref:uncharacterized protein n=1 Tax=Penicillium riverlandense TaxID=1903569 RepID=UPI0025499DAB|nr:uncharacterized protein N7474_006702 [Penicillium riverlandense]KAJ5814925.1 hypothetical protein N7474_006702 [Penicillium riverlandense]
MHSKVAAALFLSSLAMAAPAFTEESAGVGMPVMTEPPPAIMSAAEAVASAIPQSVKEELSSAYMHSNIAEIESIDKYVMSEFMHNTAWQDRLPASDLAILTSEIAMASAAPSMLIPGNSAASPTAGSSTPLATATGNGGSGSGSGSDSTSTSTSASTTASGTKPTTTNGATAPTAHVAASFAGAAGLLGFMLAL